jgi:integrase
MVAKGQDPVQVARQERASRITFAEACDSWIETQKSSWSKGQMRNVELLLKKHGKSLATKSVSHIDSNMVEDAIRPLWAKSPKQAQRTSAMWARVFDYAKHKKICTGDNPAAWEGNLSYEFPKCKDTNRKHHAAMPYKQVPEFIRELRQRQNGSVAAVALEFCILTATRSCEIRGMEWPELGDLEKRVWTIPAERMKPGREHTVPLSDRPLELLKRRKEHAVGQHVFSAHRRDTPLDEKSMRQILRKMGFKVTVHGFRSSFRDWAGDETDYARAQIARPTFIAAEHPSQRRCG